VKADSRRTTGPGAGICSILVRCGHAIPKRAERLHRCKPGAVDRSEVFFSLLNPRIF